MNKKLESFRFRKRSLTLYGHKTSVALEVAFWEVLEEAALNQGISLTHLIKEVDKHRKGALSSALRLYALAYEGRKDL